MLRRFFSRRSPLTPSHIERLEGWERLPLPDESSPLPQARWVVVDVETGGLNPARDPLLAIGAVVVTGSVIEVGNSFEAVLRQATPTPADNILVHGIGAEAQNRGQPPHEALADFLGFAGKTPLVAFHAPFDETALDSALQRHLGRRLPNRWVDLAQLLPALYPGEGQCTDTLDHWLDKFHIQNLNRHNAIADALATAQIFLQALTRAAGEGAATTADLLRIEAARRRLAEGENWHL